MSAKHTPWAASRAVNVPRGWVVNRADGELVAVVGVFGPGTQQDAQLIAAAPELLALLKDWREACGPMVHDELAALTDAAIAKATGEQA